jgi:glycerate kinase
VKDFSMKLSKVIIAPDSFKGVLTAKRAAEIIAGEVSAAFPGCEVVKMPIADGGEGSVDAILSAVGGEFHTVKVLSPDDRQIDATYGIAESGAAIIEMAQSSGITRQIGFHPMTSTTYGFGQLILAALDRGAREFVLCIGGSATTDGGCGMAAALGVRFLDGQGDSFIPCGERLCDIMKIDTSGIDGRIAESKFTVMCDVDNPLFGIRGAAHVYGPQKGASPEQVLELDKGLRHYGAVLAAFLESAALNGTKSSLEEAGIPLTGGISDIPGAGAAGGLGAGCIAFIRARLMSGIDAILDLCDFAGHRMAADLIITGEGQLDSQSFQGKVLSGILREAGGVPVWSICGVCDCDESVLREHGVVVFEASEGISREESMRDAGRYLREAAKRCMRQVEMTNDKAQSTNDK